MTGVWESPPPAVVPPDLAPHVERVHGYAASGVTPGVHRGLPSATLTMVVAIGGPLGTADSWDDWQGGRVERHPVVLGGLHTRPAFVEQPRDWCGVQVDLDPLSAVDLFGVPAAALPVTTWDARDLLGAAVDRLVDRLADTSSWNGRYALVIEFLRARRDAARRYPRSAEVAEAWRHLQSAGGNVRIDDLSRHVGYSRRHLGTLFAAETGVSLKTAGRLIRFDRARHAVARQAVGSDRALDLADLAAAHGYYDHSHLVRDFREFTGLSPTGWVAAEFPNIQASVDLDQAS